MSDTIRIRLFSSGYCTANERHVHPKEASRTIRFYATWALIEHPALGNIVFDTGYSPRFFEATRSFPNRLYRLSTPVFYQNGESCTELLRQNGVDPAGVQHLVISHFHGDHICGLHDFDKIPVWCTHSALDHALRRTRWNGVFSGILKPLIPANLRAYARCPDTELEEIRLGPLRAWRWTDDLSFVDLPGHCRGQMGLLVRNTHRGDVLLCADGVWSSKAVREKIYPARIVSLFIDDYRALTQTIDQLHTFHRENPGVLILPTHCPETRELTEN